MCEKKLLKQSKAMQSNEMLHGRQQNDACEHMQKERNRNKKPATRKKNAKDKAEI